MGVQSGTELTPAIGAASYDIRVRLGYDGNEQYSYGFSSGFTGGNTQGYGAGFQAGYRAGIDEANASHEGDELSQVAFTDGRIVGQSEGYLKGYEAGHSLGHAMGSAINEIYEPDQLTEYDDGFAEGKGAGGSGIVGDLVDPVVTDISVPTTPNEPWIVHVYDGTGLALVQLSCKDSDIRLTIYDPLDGGFVHPFNGKSTVTGSGTSADPYIFTVYRRGGWPTGVDFSLVARAIDGGGNETDG